MQTDLIFDLGMHDGSDTAYYLKKGFRVVAVEADPQLADAGRARFAQAISDGRLTIVNKAIAERAGTVVLNRSENTLWSTIDTDRSAAYNDMKGVAFEPVEVEAITCAQLIEAYGTPYYLKIDIEGLDTVAVASLCEVVDKPVYVSMETTRASLASVREDMELLTQAGYDRFKVVAQHKVDRQREPRPVREGVAAGAPVHETSGLFGRDLPGPWLTLEEGVEAFRRPLLDNALTGSSALVGNRWARAVLKRVGFRAGWYDIHAWRAGTADA